jgi:hypothetical protein
MLTGFVKSLIQFKFIIILSLLFVSNLYIEFKYDDNLPVSSIVKVKSESGINLNEGGGRTLLDNFEYLDIILGGDLGSCGEFCNQYIPYLFINKICQNNCKVIMSERSELLSERLFTSLTNRQIEYKNLNSFNDNLVEDLQNTCASFKKSANTAPNLFIFNLIDSQTFTQDFSNTFLIIPQQIDGNNYLCGYHE